MWKEFGYNSVVYLAALTGIDPGLYEAANIDGSRQLKVRRMTTAHMITLEMR